MARLVKIVTVVQSQQLDQPVAKYDFIGAVTECEIVINIVGCKAGVVAACERQVLTRQDQQIAFKLVVVTIIIANCKIA